MAHHNKFLSVNLNKSYGKSSSSTASYGNGRPRSAGGGGGMVVLSRLRSPSGAVPYKSTPKLSVPPPVNLPSLRKEHERFDSSSLKPSAGFGGPGPGNTPSMGWTKPAPPVPDSSEKDSGARTTSLVDQRIISGTSLTQGFVEKAVILRGEDFPSLLATSTTSLQQKQKLVRERSDGWAQKVESSVLAMRPQLRSSQLMKSDMQGSDDGSNLIVASLDQSKQADRNYPVPLSIVRVRHTYDWDDDERDRNHVFSGGEARNHLSRDSGRAESYRRELFAAKNEDLSTSRLLSVDRDHASAKNSAISKETVKESITSRSPFGDKRLFGSANVNGTAEAAEASNSRAEISNSWHKGKTVSNGPISKGLISPVSTGFPSNNPVLNFSKEKPTSNVRKPYVEDDIWGGKGTLTSDDIIDLRAKVFRKKRETTKHSDLFDPARESFEAELEMVQQLQEQERQRILEEQSRAMEFAKREAEERNRIAREEEEKRRLIEEEAREAAWRAEQEKMEAAKRAEEQRIARDEEKRKILMEEERRKEAARKKLLELEARIALRQREANSKSDSIKEMCLPMELDAAERKKAGGMVEVITNSASSDSFLTNKSSETRSRPNSSSIENYSYSPYGKAGNNAVHDKGASFKFKDQHNGYLSLHNDAFSSKGGFSSKDFRGNHGPVLAMQPFKGGISDDLIHLGPILDKNRDDNQFIGRLDVNAGFSHDHKFDDRGWEHGHFDGSYIVSYSERPFQSTEVDGITSSSRVRNSLRQPRVLPPPSLSSSMRRNSFKASPESPNSSVLMTVDAPNDQTGRREESDMQIMYDCRYQQRIQETRTTELLEETGSYFLQMDENCSPRYDSQSSLSVSNPPSTPTQPSHDELDDCGGSPVLTTSAEGESIIFSDCKNVLQEMDAKHRDTITHLSQGEDDEWAVENYEAMQELEDHKEGHDSSVENNEIHESDNVNVQMENMLEDLGLVIENPIRETRHSSYNGNECVRLGALGNCVLDNVSGNVDNNNKNLGNITDFTSDLSFMDNSANIVQSDDALPDRIIDSTAAVAEKSDTMSEDPVISPLATVDNDCDSIRASETSGQNPMAPESRLPLPSTLSSCCTTSSLPIISCQDEIPVKLQFGLFSGPPLIPSPLPIIQIGSIQMPLPLLAQNDSSTQMHPSQPPLFQFGQLSYTPSISQCALPMAAQAMSIMHPPALSHLPINQNHGSFSNNQFNKSSTSPKRLEAGQHSVSSDDHVIISRCQNNLNTEQHSTLLNVSEGVVLVPQSQMSLSDSTEKKALYNPSSPLGTADVASIKYFRSTVNSKRVRGRPDVDSLSSIRKAAVGRKSPGTMSDIRGNRFTYNYRNAGSLSFFARPESLHFNSGRPQRRFSRHVNGTGYRAKKNNGTRQMNSTESLDHMEKNENSASFNGFEKISSRNVGRKGPYVNKPTKLTNEEAASCNSQVMGACSSTSRASPEETVTKTMIASCGKVCGEGNLKWNNVSEDDIDAPMQSGIIRVFNQPGIEASADADGFVEVRSKRKILNERRGQREKETNSKYKVIKVPRRHRAVLSNNGISTKSDMAITSIGGASSSSVNVNASIGNRRLSAALEFTRLGAAGIESQNMTPSSISNVDLACSEAKLKDLKSSRVNSETFILSDEANLAPSLSYAENVVALDKGVRGTAQLDQLGQSSTQSQLDETLTTVQANADSVSQASLDHCKHATATMNHENPSSSSTSLLNFPFTGEKIQFGAVASLPTLSPSSQSVSGGIWPPGSVILNASIVHNLTVNDNFNKNKHSTDSCSHLDDNEAEAEAAASAVAVAAISNDEITVSTLSSDSISNETKVFRDPGITRCMDGLAQSASEESLIVTLPADLTVDTPHTLWPPPPNLQPSCPILSNISGSPPSSFPFFDPNPMLGSPMFSYRSRDDSTGTQPQHNAKFGSGPSGTWPQCHSGVDSFYGSPAGFPAPFMNPQGGLTGVHGQPQMVFYNHFTPVGQFGQVGIGYMGSAAYIPTGSQHEQASSMHSNKSDQGNQNSVYGSHKSAHFNTPIQHLSSGSAIMPVTSPFTMFNLRPFQSSTDVSVPAHWPPISHLSNAARLPAASELQQSIPSDMSDVNFVSQDPRPYIVDLPDELGLMESTSSNSVHALQTIQQSSGILSTTSNMREPNGTRVGAQKMASESPAIKQQLGPIGKSDQPSGTMKTQSGGGGGGGEWHRRDNFHWKHHKAASEKKVSSKIKQVYVAKSRPSDHATPC